MNQFWLLMGLLFFAFGLYLGFDYELIAADAQADQSPESNAPAM